MNTNKICTCFILPLISYTPLYFLLVASARKVHPGEPRCFVSLLKNMPSYLLVCLSVYMSPTCMLHCQSPIPPCITTFSWWVCISHSRLSFSLTFAIFFPEFLYSWYRGLYYEPGYTLTTNDRDVLWINTTTMAILADRPYGQTTHIWLDYVPSNPTKDLSLAVTISKIHYKKGVW